MNKSFVGHGKIAKDYILFTTPDKPLPRAGKGTIQRQRAVDLYKQEADAFYDEKSTTKRGPATSRNTFDLATLETTQASLQVSLQAYIAQGFDLDWLKLDDDFFNQGGDSLQTLTLLRAINDSIAIGHDAIDVKQVYKNPTIRKLAASLHSDAPRPREDDDDIDSWIQMQQIFHLLSPKLHNGRVQNISSPPRLELNHLKTERSASASDTDGIPPLPFETSASLEKGPSDKSSAYDALQDKNFLISMIPPDGGSIA